ncbi:MAG: pilus assembly protein [Aeromicrobium sp.]|uniref:TadE/TadG family type IV pilus assembly protein n=1 Tax=Aeromicrobium sp. TaxID=1871063 RepID=UPI00261E6EC1|nr:TadE/TadG family type IV pilus assembly protein [Aeromicrobium sp.]MDF1706340.1 pilus assembly protein [Aeromicrobium sp.]
MTRRRHREDGVAAVEFALIAPLFIALVFGIISYGYMLSFRQGMSQAAAEGARVFAVAPTVGVSTTGSLSTKDAAIAAINRSLSSYSVTCTAAGTLTRNGATVGTCSVPSTATACTNNAATKCVKVDLRYSYRANPLIPSFPGLGVVLPETLTYNTTVQVNS